MTRHGKTSDPKLLESVTQFSFGAHERLVAVVLAAGPGTRMGTDLPKGLSQVGPLRIADYLESCLRPITTYCYVGYRAETWRQLGPQRWTYRPFPDWQTTNNAATLRFALSELLLNPAWASVLVTNGDVVADPKCVQRLLRSEADAVAVSCSNLGDEDMMAVVRNGRIESLGKGEVTGFRAGTLYLFTRELANRLFRTIPERSQEWFERYVSDLAARFTLVPVDMSDLLLQELDTPRDLLNLQHLLNSRDREDSR